jgi:hypothetical protein
MPQLCTEVPVVPQTPPVLLPPQPSITLATISYAALMILGKFALEKLSLALWKFILRGFSRLQKEDFRNRKK